MLLLQTLVTEVDLLVSLVLLACTIGFAYLVEKRNITIVTESGLAVVLGAFVGLIIRLSDPKDSVRFNDALFFYILLPIIIFEAGYGMKHRNFFSNFTSVLTFAFLGTLITAIVVGILLYLGGQWGLVGEITAVESLLFGSLIAATDPVATLSVFQKVNCSPTLYTLVFGESVLNDAIAIVLFQTFQSYLNGFSSFTAVSGLMAFFKFVLVILGSCLIGSLVALSLCFIMKRTHFPTPAHDISMQLFFAYGCYVIANILDLSGIMALFVCGVILSHYNLYNLSMETQAATKNVFKTFTFISESFVFVYLGFCVFSYPGLKWDPRLIFYCFFLILIARAANVFPLSLLLNIGRKEKISLKMQVAMWFAGLRGAIAFALSLNLDDSGTYEVPHKNELIATTLFIVLFTTLVFGGATAPLLGALKLKQTPAADVQEQFASASSVASRGSRKSRGGLHRRWRIIDEMYMKPLFGGSRRLTEQEQGRELVTTTDE